MTVLISIFFAENKENRYFKERDDVSDGKIGQHHLSLSSGDFSKRAISNF
jgi:hypothetical protein